MKLLELESFKGSRLRSIDALRGVAALAVVIYHAVGQAPHDEHNRLLLWLGVPIREAVSYGYTGVFLFFVISGFCIHLHWAKARAAGQEPTIEFMPFWKRRFRRLYPPYLIALILYLLVVALTTDVRYSLWDITLHLLMLHNLDSHTSYSINGVFWTLAIEEQLYLAYFLLLFLRGRWGWTRTLMCCALARVGWFILAAALQRYFGIETPISEAAASHWLTWALGALSVEAAMGLIILPRWCLNLWLSLASLASAVAISYALPHFDASGMLHHVAWLALHPLWGFGFFIIINRAVLAEKRWRETLHLPRLVAVLSVIGIFSYSLYLTHQLLMLEMWRFYILHMPSLLVALFVMTPLSVGFAWLFFQFCERPYLPPSPAKSLNANAAQNVDPVSA